MKMFVLFALMYCVLLAVSQDAPTTGPKNPYCDQQLCPMGKRHVACERFFNESHKVCTTEHTVLVNLTNQSEIILKAHNEQRQRLAMGKNTILPRAARLVAMQWSEELATLASYNARMCQAKHDECHNTANFKRSGQNIILFNMTRLVENELMEKMYPQLLGIGVRTWWGEHSSNSSNLMTAADVEHYPCPMWRGRQSPLFRHFAVMAVENNTHVGCAASRYVAKEITYFKLTCNYAENFVCGRPIYHFRAVGCLTGPNMQHKALCSKKEIFA
ncbi:antigen 5 like allergen Cul n 1-like [Drosophila albomicans]|uniref:Antigen 5 like allergen Cul n 1-like n=1 Tax=Drosophila albomicans TaxID=7291 RepID=A0A6P8X0L1_DROAB|nr:antigen 5 like allergen Cul n 1-like [Drosophila albomicans]